MNLNYHKWLDIEITNNYFPNGCYADFEVVPCLNTKNQMKNYDLLTKQVDNHLLFYLGGDPTEKFSVEQNLNGLEFLYFQLIAKDLNFFNYTDLPFFYGEQVYCLENGVNQSDPALFHHAQFVTTTDLVKYRSTISNIRLPNQKVNLEIKNNKGESVREEIIDGVQVNNYTIDLAPHGAGIYEIWMNNELKEKCYVSSTELMENCIGIVVIDVPKIVKNYSNNLSYSICFNARSLYWEYQLVLKKSRKIQISEMSLIGTENEGYEGPIEKRIVGGEVSQVFTAPRPVQLQKELKINPLLKVTYSNEFSSRENQMDIKLPNPSVEQLKKYNQGKNEGAFFLSTIVYV